MADAMNPQNPAYPAARQRPGLVTFAAIMMFVLAGFHLTFALGEYASANWIAANVEGMYGGPLWLWGIIDTAIAVLAVYAGYELLRGGGYGRIFGLVIAAVSAIRWFFVLPWAPLIALVVIAVDVLVIYALTTNWEYFQSVEYGRRRTRV